MKAIKNNSGSAMPLFIVVIFFILALIAVIYQNSTMITTGRSVKAAMQKVALNAITQNSEETYPSKREGYTGAYEKQLDWNPTVENIDPTDQITEMLNIAPEGTALVKRSAAGAELYRLDAIQLAVENTEFLTSSNGIKATVRLNLVFPVNYPLLGKQSITIPIKATAENKMKF